MSDETFSSLCLCVYENNRVKNLEQFRGLTKNKVCYIYDLRANRHMHILSLPKLSAKDLSFITDANIWWLATSWRNSLLFQLKEGVVHCHTCKSTQRSETDNTEFT